MLTSCPLSPFLVSSQTTTQSITLTASTQIQHIASWAVENLKGRGSNASLQVSVKIIIIVCFIICYLVLTSCPLSAFYMSSQTTTQSITLTKHKIQHVLALLS